MEERGGEGERRGREEREETRTIPKIHGRSGEYY